jgi:hypothetical protein
MTYNLQVVLEPTSPITHNEPNATILTYLPASPLPFKLIFKWVFGSVVLIE